MERRYRSRNPRTHTTSLPIRPRAPSPQTTTTLPITNNFLPIHGDRCPYSACTNPLPHQHPPTDDTTSPSIEEYRNASSATRQQWTQSQQRRIAENEALLRQLAEITPKVGNLSIKTHLPRGNDLTVQEQIAIIHGSVTPGQYATVQEMLLARQREEISNNTNSISLISSARLGTAQNKAASQASDLEWDDFPELDAQYGPPPKRQMSQTLPPPLKTPPKTPASASHDSALTPPNAPIPCTGPCPVQTPHNQGAYLQQGQVPRVWNARWGYSDPPRQIWDAWVRVEQGRGSGWDEVEVDGFAVCHWWGGGVGEKGRGGEVTEEEDGGRAAGGTDM